MPQQHLDRLNSVDAGFLHQEDGRDSHMHIGGLAIYEGPPPTEDELLAHMASRMHLVTRFRQKLAYPPLGSGRPVWVDDSTFSLEYHVRRSALPRPGNEEQLLRLVSRLISQRLDRSKPLWEVWVVEGLTDDRWCMISKTHHALVDGVGGIDLMTALVDLTPEPRVVEPEPWVPAGSPGLTDYASRGARGAVEGVRELATGVLSRATDPRRLLGDSVERVGGVAEVLRNFVTPAPATPLNAAPGPHRTFSVVRTELKDFKSVKDALGGTLNDVVLTVVAGALRTYLEELGVDVNHVRLRACVPMSIRTSEQRGGAGNQISLMVAELPTDVADAGRRHELVSAHMGGLKKGRQSVGAQTLVQMEQWMPPNVLAQASRLGFSSRLYNLLVTNVPGPQFPVYMMGRQMTEVFPIAFLAPEHRVAIAILSYDGAVSFGLLGDADGLGPLDPLAKGIDVALQELLELARSQ